MAEPPVTTQKYLDKYESDVVNGTWLATGIFTGIAYGAGVVVRPFAPKAAGKIASLGSSTHLPHAGEFRGPAYPRASLLTLLNALPAPGWIVPPEIFGLSPGYIIAPGEFGPDASKLLHLAGLEPTQERVDMFNAVIADKTTRHTQRIVRDIDTNTLVTFHTTVNAPDFASSHPQVRVSEVSAIYYGELLRRKVLDVPPASEFEKGLLFHATPVTPPPATNPPTSSTKSPVLTLLPAVAATITATPDSFFGTVAMSARNAPETFTPTNAKALANVAAATGLRKQLATERFDP